MKFIYFKIWKFVEFAVKNRLIIRKYSKLWKTYYQRYKNYAVTVKVKNKFESLHLSYYPNKINNLI